MPKRPDHRQHQRERGKGRDQHGAEAVAAGRFPGDVFERHHAPHAHELLLVHPCDRGAYRRRQHSRAPRRGTDDQEHVAQRVLRHRHVDLLEGFGLIGATLDLSRDADDLAFLRLSATPRSHAATRACRSASAPPGARARRPR